MSDATCGSFGGTIGASYDTLIPHWCGVAKNIALIQPSSAFMERVFSILRACMDERQASCFSDRIAAAALLKYNRELVHRFGGVCW